MTTSAPSAAGIVFCHRELPPLQADPMSRTHARLEQEIARLGGDFAHVLHESVDSRHDDARGEAWLRGRFTYVLYRLPKDA